MEPPTADSLKDLPDGELRGLIGFGRGHAAADLVVLRRPQGLPAGAMPKVGGGDAGAITAASIKALVPDPDGFTSARHFAAWLGLTPRPHSTGRG